MSKFCIITPTFPGREPLLLRAIESVKGQSTQDHTHLVCGDGPCPAAKDMCNEYGVNFINTSERLGNWGTGARNFAIKHVEDEFILFLDDDNYLLDDCIQTIRDHLNKSCEHANPPIAIYKSLYYARSLKKHVILPPTPQVEKTKIDMGNFCVRRDIAQQIEFQADYNHDFTYIADCCRIAGGYNILWINKVLMVYLFAPPGTFKDILENEAIW